MGEEGGNKAMTGNDVSLVLAVLAVGGFWLVVNLCAGATWLKVISIFGVLFCGILAAAKVAQVLL